MRFLGVVIVIVGCGGNGGARPDARTSDAARAIDAAADAALDAVGLIDAKVDAPSDSSVSMICDVLTQVGCSPGEKCTWIHDATTPTPLGHIGCAPNGSVAVSGNCQYGPDGPTGYDNCTGGVVCQGGKCKTICNLGNGAPMCGAMFGCGSYEGLFGPVGQPAAAGVCDPSCSPLDDNDFLGSGTKVGTACPNIGAQLTGCYGYPSSSHHTRWSCTREVTANHNIVHRTACTTANGCANPNGNPYLNGCAQGYIPLLYDITGSTQIDCIAICKPGNTYMGNAGTQYPAGQSPHGCNTTDARGVFNTATLTNNGEHCMYSWDFEIDTNGTLLRSPTSDTVGFCLDHSKYKYDSNANGFIDGSDANWPLCAGLPLTAGSGQPKAGDFGCVDSVTAGVPFVGKVVHPVIDLRLPYATSSK